MNEEDYNRIEMKLKQKLGSRYSVWHTKEVLTLISKGYEEDKIITSYVKKRNKGVK